MVVEATAAVAEAMVVEEDMVAVAAVAAMAAEEDMVAVAAVSDVVASAAEGVAALAAEVRVGTFFQKNNDDRAAGCACCALMPAVRG